MPKSYNQKGKLLYLMRILLEQTDHEHPLTISEIIDKLQNIGIRSERKSLYNDFEVLREFGILVEQQRTKTVGYFVEDRVFELPELKLLVDLVQTSKFITHKKSSKLIKKLESFASIHQSATLQRNVFVANRIKSMNESIYYNVDLIQSAILSNLKISFKYFEWNTNKEKQLRKNGKDYIVSPLFFSWVEGFGNKMKIIYPESVSNKMRDFAKELFEIYE